MPRPSAACLPPPPLPPDAPPAHHPPVRGWGPLHLPQSSRHSRAWRRQFCWGWEWCQSEALRAAVPSNLQQRKDSLRLKFRAPARGTSHDHPQSQVDRRRRQSAGSRAGGTPSPAASHGSCVICLRAETARPRPCTSGFPATRAAELKPGDFPGGARPSLGPPPAVRNPGVTGGLVASGTNGEGLGRGTACPAWGAGRSFHGL